MEIPTGHAGAGGVYGMRSIPPISQFSVLVPGKLLKLRHSCRRILTFTHVKSRKADIMKMNNICHL